MDKKQSVVVIGGGFAGLEFIKKLGHSQKYQVTLVDVNNYNFFPPLIYQVASGLMEPSAISYPFRKILRKFKNVRFRLGELQEIVPAENKVLLDNGELAYDLLVIATGTEPNFFGNKNIEKYALPMKSISDGLLLRNVILSHLDKATQITDNDTRHRLLTFVVAGAGPTGVELSGVMAEMRNTIMQKDYPDLAGQNLGNIYLVDGQKAVLANMSEKSQTYTQEKLTELGVKTKLNVFVKDFDGKTVSFSDDSQIETNNLIWTAGVTAKVFKGLAESAYGPGHRLKTNAHNQVEGYENIFALGDTALLEGDPDYPKGHPQMAQVALQQANNLAANLDRDKSDWQPFAYKNKGALAIIGRNKAVFDSSSGKGFMQGFLAWLAWLFVHIMSLVNFKNRLRTFYDWMGYYIFRDQSFRMIIKPSVRKCEDEASPPVNKEG